MGTEAGFFDELGHAHPLQFGNVRLPLLIKFRKLLIDLDQVPFLGQLGQLFGQRQRLPFGFDFAQEDVFQLAGPQGGFSSHGCGSDARLKLA